MIQVAAEQDFTSVGQLYADLQQTPRAFERACEKLKIKPAMRLNRTPYYDAEAVEKITAHFREAGK